MAPRRTLLALALVALALTAGAADGAKKAEKQKGENVLTGAFFFFRCALRARARPSSLPLCGPGAWTAGGLASRPALLSVVRRRAKASEWWWVAAGARVGPGGAPALARPPDRRGPWCPRLPPPPLAPFKRKLPRERAAGGVSGSPRPLLPPPLPCDVDCTRIVRVGGVWCVEPRPVGADEKEAARSELKRRSLFLLLSALLCLLRIVPYVASSGAACTLCMCWHCRARGNWGRAAPCSALRRGGGERTRTRFRKTRSRSLSLLAHP